MESNEAVSVGQLFRRSKNALARDFRGFVWVKGEIKAIREQRGSLYLTLVDPGDYNDGGDISLDVAAWPKRNALLQAQLRQAGMRLVAGMVVNVEGTVTLSKVGRLQVELNRLDTEALMGRQEAEKRRVVESLVAEGVFEQNRKLAVPLVPLRVGLVASENSEGFNDFLGQLQRSPFAFDVTFRHSAVQGPAAPASLARAIAELSTENLDVLAVVRGGGGELEAYDKEPVVRAIATSPTPVWTGVGHTGDSSLADQVANASFITPTECGQALVNAVGQYADHVAGLTAAVHRYSERLLDAESSKLAATGRHLISAVQRGVEQSRNRLHRQGEKARRCADRDLALSAQRLDGLRREVTRGSSIVTQESQAHLQQVARRLRSETRALLVNVERDARGYRLQISSLDPARQLRRGYSLTRDADGRLVRDISQVRVGTTITTQLTNGTTTSTVNTTEATEN